MSKLPEGMNEFLQENSTKNLSIDSIDVKGKFMWWSIGPWKLWCTYGMTGQWSRRPADKNTALVVWVDDCEGGNLTSVNFHDPRRFGTIKLVRSEKLHQKKLASLGADILESTSLSPEIFAERILMKTNRTICEALMDQSAVSGIGNYLRAEILFACKINPWQNVVDISAKNYVDLCESSKKISQQSYESQGATIKTYRSVDGSTGRTQFMFKVYAQKLCPSGHEISRKNDSTGRMMHWCPICQT